MASFRFIHCADLHIDSPLRGLEADPDAPVDRIRNATRDAFTALVSYAIASRVDFVLAAGDLYDGEWQDWRTGQFLVRQVSRLTNAGIPFIAIRGNHDAQSVITRQLRLPDGAHQLSAERPETFSLAGLDVLIHGQSFPTAAVRQDLTKHYPPPAEGKFNIGLLHTNVSGQPGHENYAPSNLSDLRNHGYQYWALGHVHTRTTLAQDPWIIYPGNLQGRHARETGPRGAMLVTVTNGVIAEPPQFLPFDTVRWDRLEVDVSAANDADAALAIARGALTDAMQAAGDRLLAARVLFTGVTPACAELSRNPGDIREKLRAEAQILGGLDNIWIESVAISVTAPKARNDSLDLLSSEIASLDVADLGAPTARYAKELLDRLPGLRDEIRQLDDQHPVLLAESDAAPPPALLERARNLLLARLADN
jgi:predicted phosphodiesterase